MKRRRITNVSLFCTKGGLYLYSKHGITIVVFSDYSLKQCLPQWSKKILELDRDSEEGFNNLLVGKYYYEEEGGG